MSTEVFTIVTEKSSSSHPLLNSPLRIIVFFLINFSLAVFIIDQLLGNFLMIAFHGLLDPLVHIKYASMVSPECIGYVHDPNYYYGLREAYDEEIKKYGYDLPFPLRIVYLLFHYCSLDFGRTMDSHSSVNRIFITGIFKSLPLLVISYSLIGVIMFFLFSRYIRLLVFVNLRSRVKNSKENFGILNDRFMNNFLFFNRIIQLVLVILLIFLIFNGIYTHHNDYYDSLPLEDFLLIILAVTVVGLLVGLFLMSCLFSIRTIVKAIIIIPLFSLLIFEHLYSYPGFFHWLYWSIQIRELGIIFGSFFIINAFFIIVITLVDHFIPVSVDDILPAKVANENSTHQDFHLYLKDIKASFFQPSSFIITILGIVVIVSLILVSSAINPQDVFSEDYSPYEYQFPSPDHLFGRNSLGDDILLRIILSIGGFCLNGLIGGGLAVLSGFFFINFLDEKNYHHIIDILKSIILFFLFSPVLIVTLLFSDVILFNTVYSLNIHRWSFVFIGYCFAIPFGGVFIWNNRFNYRDNPVRTLWTLFISVFIIYNFIIEFLVLLTFYPANTFFSMGNELKMLSPRYSTVPSWVFPYYFLSFSSVIFILLLSLVFFCRNVSIRVVTKHEHEDYPSLVRRPYDNLARLLAVLLEDVGLKLES